MDSFNCFECNKEEMLKNRFEINKKRFCSLKCAHQYREKIVIPEEPQQTRYVSCASGGQASY